MNTRSHQALLFSGRTDLHFNNNQPTWMCTQKSSGMERLVTPSTYSREQSKSVQAWSVTENILREHSHSALQSCEHCPSHYARLPPSQSNYRTETTHPHHQHQPKSTYAGDHNQAIHCEIIEMHQLGSGHTNAAQEEQSTALIRSDISGLLTKRKEKNDKESCKCLLEEEDRIGGWYHIFTSTLQYHIHSRQTTSSLGSHHQWLEKCQESNCQGQDHCRCLYSPGKQSHL